MSEEEVLVTGYAKLPEDITAREFYSVLAVGLLIDSETGIIKDADCTLVTSVARGFFKKLVVGENINEIDKIIHNFEKRYLGQAKKAIIAALKMCYAKFINK